MNRSYLHGIIECADGVDLGISDVNAVGPVGIITHDGLGCVVSDYEGDGFQALSQEKLVRSLLAHQLVVERVMQHHTVLPVKFGTLLDSSQDVLALLSQGRGKFLKAIAAIQGRVEIEIAATWDLPQVLQRLGVEDEVVRARQALTQGGQLTLENRVRLGQVVKVCLGKLRAGYQERMVSFLKPAVLSVAPNALLSDEMVMNVAFLVERARHLELEALVQKLDELFQREFTFRMIGPLPPYSFSSVAVTMITLEQLEASRLELRLGHVMSGPDVRQAYRRLVAQIQRNLSPGNELTSAQFIRLRQAKELLLRYCQAKDEALQSQEGHGSAHQDVGPLFVISIESSGGDEVEPARFGGFAGM